MTSKRGLVVTGDLIPTRRLPDGWPWFDSRDTVFGDLETTFTKRGARWEKPVVYRSDPSIASQLISAGFSIVSLANNQSMNYGREGLEDTFVTLEQIGLPYVGAGRNIDEARRHRIVEIDGTKVAFVATTCLAPQHWEAQSDLCGLSVVRPKQAFEIDGAWSNEEPGVPPTVRTWLEQADIELATSQVEKALEYADIVVASVHWGVGTMETLTGYQRQLGQALLGAGASLVLGSHSPRLQGFEQTEKGLISYSLGTFLRQQPQQGVGTKLQEIYRAMPKETAVLRLEIDNGRFSSATVSPAKLDENGLAHPVSGKHADYITGTILDRSSNLNIRPAPTPDSSKICIDFD